MRYILLFIVLELLLFTGCCLKPNVPFIPVL
jgi:hypothetical protein